MNDKDKEKSRNNNGIKLHDLLKQQATAGCHDMERGQWTESQSF